MGKLQNKLAIITGGSSGIGAAIVEKFVSEGAVVHVLDLKQPAPEDQIPKVTYHAIDITDQNRMKDWFGSFSRLDILVNNAGIGHIGNAESTLEDDFDRVIKVNVKGYYNTIHLSIPLMKEKGGSIINIASVAGSVGISDRFAYSTSKAAVMGMTLSVAKDYLAYQIRCNSVSPARVHTPFVDAYLKANYPGKEEEMFANLAKTQPIGRMGTPDEVASMALFLASDEASFLTGCDYLVDGGFVKLNS